MENVVSFSQWQTYRKRLARAPPPHVKSYHSPLPITTFLFSSLHPYTNIWIPQRSHFSGASLPLYERFEIFCENMSRIVFIKLFKP